MVKLIHINPHTSEETTVATFKTVNEAAACRDLLQAKCANQEYSYYSIQYKTGGQIVRQSADTFTRQLPFFNQSVLQSIKSFLS